MQDFLPRTEIGPSIDFSVALSLLDHTLGEMLRQLWCLDWWLYCSLLGIFSYILLYVHNGPLILPPMDFGSSLLLLNANKKISIQISWCETHQVFSCFRLGVVCDSFDGILFILVAYATASPHRKSGRLIPWSIHLIASMSVLLSLSATLFWSWVCGMLF